MKTLKQLSSLKSLVWLFLFNFIIYETYSNEPIDIWNIDKKSNQVIQKKENSNANNLGQMKIKGTKIEQNKKISVDQNLNTSKIKLAGLYDPSENGLSIEMWTNSDGEKIKYFLDKIQDKKLSTYSEKILDVVLFTNSYMPQNNITSKEFLNYKYNHLIKKKNFDLIKEFVKKNSDLKFKDKVIKFYANHFLSINSLDEACEIFDYASNFTDEYLNYFNIYCLILNEKKEQAQLLFDISSEFGSIDKFFSKKFGIMMGYEDKDNSISDRNTLFFHLSHITNENFEYEPTMETPKFIWTYLSSNNLLKKADTINIENADEIKLFEKATNQEIYKEKELLELYKKFQFNLNQLLKAEDLYKNLQDYEGRALLYQRYLLSVDIEKKLVLASNLFDSYKASNLTNAFDEELSIFLKSINKEEVPSNFTNFYISNIEPEKIEQSKIKYNNKIIHQSKLINYFLNKTSLKKTEDDVNNLLKKIKKNKKYIYSTKDIILLESLKSDGVKIDKKYKNLYEFNSNLPAEINSMIVNGETGLVLLKLIDIIGEDKVENLDIESVSFIVNIMNNLKIISLRNDLLVKVLPLKG